LKKKIGKGTTNGYIQRENKRETESRQKQYDRTTLSEIKAWHGPMGHQIKHAKRRQKRECNGKYETAIDALNPQL
jgi:hypothetical protein